MTADARDSPIDPKRSRISHCHTMSSAWTSSPAWDAYATTNTAVSPEMRYELSRRGVVLAQRSVLNLLERQHDELRARRPPIRNGCNGCCRSNPLSSWPSTACNPMSATRFSGVSCDCVSGESPPGQELTLRYHRRPGDAAVRGARPCRSPSPGVISDGQQTIRQAVARGYRACRIGCATSTTCVRPLGRSTRRTAMPKLS